MPMIVSQISRGVSASLKVFVEMQSLNCSTM